MSAPPVGRFSPSHGLTVNHSPKLIQISGSMEVYGPGATPALTRQLQKAINSFWTKTFSNGQRITCSVTLVYKAPGKQSWFKSTSIELSHFPAPSYVRPGIWARQMKLNASDPNIDWAVAHEFGHILGLEDKYSESISSRLSGLMGGARNAPPVQGYRGNVMAQDSGKLWKRNLADLVSETAPFSVYEDDQIRDWISSNPNSVKNLDTATKLAILRNLSQGVISEADLVAVEAVLKSVQTRAEADSIRLEFQATSFIQLGGTGDSASQRAQASKVYRAFTTMPQ